MFKQATKDIASELDPYGMLVPVPGANDSFKFELLYLVKKVVSLWPWKPVKYLPTGVKLEQVLVKGDTVDIGQISRSVGTISSTSSRHVEFEGKVCVSAVETDGKAGITINRSLASTCIEKLEVSLDELMNSLPRIRFDMSHWLVKKLRKQKVDGLCLVIESIRAKNQLKLQETQSADGSMKFSAQATAKIGADINGRFQREIMVDEGTVLAFKVYELCISEDGRLCGAATPTKKKLSFIEYDGTVFLFKRIRGTVFSCLDFGSLKAYIKKQLNEFDNLDKITRVRIWTPLSELLLHREALAVLEHMLEDSSVGDDGEPSPLDSLGDKEKQPIQKLLEFLGIPSNDAGDNYNLVKSIKLFVCALNDLDEQTVTKICSLDKDVHKQQLQMVDTILEQGLYSTCTLEQNWTNELTGDGLRLGKDLLTSCGLNISDDTKPGLNFALLTSQKPRLLALYVTLCGVESLGPW
ncbi:hypothetical protein AOXY_G2288 [Acipenser oxyrinchus oxyrinchus]|uniref:Gasdermin pore forming domain-containing protein n=1 Tax=Acipenser oxyrinchus oxyrinchus TaxID=40147 RepID=A0AAD8GHT6_ACIOX|nr:hypothetical protein AOXY_G2288 [Acipenser oxyrinchus oxyrinchus]